jgi:hypothetical protein
MEPHKHQVLVGGLALACACRGSGGQSASRDAGPACADAFSYDKLNLSTEPLHGTLARLG